MRLSGTSKTLEIAAVLITSHGISVIELKHLEDLILRRTVTNMEVALAGLKLTAILHLTLDMADLPGHHFAGAELFAA
jgi:hypothetical protein